MSPPPMAATLAQSRHVINQSTAAYQQCIVTNDAVIPAILKVGHGDELFDFLIFEKLWGNCGCVDGFEEYLPGGEDDVACQCQEIAEKGGALCELLACRQPGRLDEIE